MESCGFHFYRPNSLLKVEGPDAREYLQGQFSADLGRTQGGECVYGLWLDRKGKIVADSFALCRSPEEYWLASYYSNQARLRRRLEDYLVMDEVELEDAREERRAIAVWGDRAVLRVEACLGNVLPDSERFLACRGVVAFWGRRGTQRVLELLASPDGNDSVIDELRTELRDCGIPELDADAMTRMAVEGVVPRVGLDVGEGDLPQEVGLVEAAVAFDKGCYLGQEVMARLRSMGRARKRLVAVRFSEPPPDLPAPLLDESGKKRGELRSNVKVDDGYAGLAIVPVGREEPLQLGETGEAVGWEADE